LITENIGEDDEANNCNFKLPKSTSSRDNRIFKAKAKFLNSNVRLAETDCHMPNNDNNNMA
jgi:hypothetical protein